MRSSIPLTWALALFVAWSVAGCHGGLHPLIAETLRIMKEHAPPEDTRIAYLSVEKATIWVRRGEEARVMNAFHAVPFKGEGWTLPAPGADPANPKTGRSVKVVLVDGPVAPGGGLLRQAPP